MAKVVITVSLKEDILKKFKAASEKIFLRMKSLETAPHKGKELSHVAGILIKELKYENNRFYFITDGNILKFGSEDEIAGLLIKFARMSEKKNQQRVIDEIKAVLRSMGFDAF
jgi:hypothetical protein